MNSEGNVQRSVVQDLVRRHKRGESIGMPSICSAHPYALEACMREAVANDDIVLVEATSNQVNQFGGYTGMTPVRYADYVRKLAFKTGLGPEHLVLGGDHLGPNAWQTDTAAVAMEKACQMVRDYVLAGFQKIHLDASMRCADDPGEARAPLQEEIVAARAAELCRAAEDTFARGETGVPAPVYVIGTEVPIPGGAQESEETLAVTTPEAAKHTVEVTGKAFKERGLQAAWERVVATVVQPGVEFGEESIFDYQPEKARALSHAIEGYGNLVFEAHSTDYQREDSLRSLVMDHFAILKVGPALTFAFREAVFSLEMIEQEWLSGMNVELSGLRRTLEQVMIDAPGYWKNYYHGDGTAQRLARGFSLSDRIRYYWPNPAVQSALDRLMANLSGRTIPLTLISQFLPKQYEAVRGGVIANRPRDLVLHKIDEVAAAYARACGRR